VVVALLATTATFVQSTQGPASAQRTPPSLAAMFADHFSQSVRVANVNARPRVLAVASSIEQLVS
jgi:hypothetical protein